MFSYGSVALADPENSSVSEWISENIQPADVFPLACRAWPNDFTNGPILANTLDEPRCITLGSLWWPWSASRFARAHFVISQQQVEEIRTRVFRAGTQIDLPLIFDDGETNIQANMWMLPCIPLQQAADGAYLYLLTLVDDRYFWWGKSLDLILGDTTSWEDLYADIGTELDDTIHVDPIPDEYGLPVDTYTTQSRPLPMILDAIAWSVQQRIVRSLDGTIKAQNQSTAESVVASNRATGPTRYAGGEFDFNPNDQNDLAALVPQTVDVAFPGTGEPPDASFFHVTVDLADLHLPDYGTIKGSPWQKLFHRYEAADFPSSTDAPTNESELTDLATQFATDWYQWQLSPLSQQYTGIVDWEPEGNHDLEWEQSRGKIRTHVMAGKFNPAEDLLTIAMPVPAGGDSDSGIVSINEDYTRHQFLTSADGTVHIVDEGNGVHDFSIDTIKTKGPCIRLVTNVCLSPGSGGGQPNISVEYVVACFPKGTTFTPPFCVVDPTGCCGSGSGGGQWWCVEYSICDDFDCEECDDPIGTVCELIPEFAFVGDSRCVAMGEGQYRYEVAIRGPFDSEAVCATFCSYVVTTCCDVVPQDLCVTLVDEDDFAPCLNVSFQINYIGLVPFGIDMVPCWEGTGEVCSHPIKITLICNGTQWNIRVEFPDHCQPTVDYGIIPLVSCSPFDIGDDPDGLPFGITFESACSGYLLGAISAATNITTAPCPSDECPVTVTPTNTGYCPDDDTLQITGTCFEFDPDCTGNTIVLQDSAGADISFSFVSCTATEIILSVDLSAVPKGPIKASVANANGNSGGLVQVGTLIECGPCVTATLLLTRGTSSNNTLTLSTVTVPEGMLVCVGAGVNDHGLNPAIFFGANGLATVASSGPLPDSSASLHMASLAITPAMAATDDITYTGQAGSTGTLLAAIHITGLPFNALDVLNFTNGIGTSPFIPNCAPVRSNVDCTVAVAAFLLADTDTPATPHWIRGFTKLIDVPLVIGGVSYTLTVAYLNLPATGDIQEPIATDITPEQWVGMGQGFK